MMTNQEEFEAKIKASLDASVYGLDKKTQDDLASIRQKILKPKQPRAWININAWIMPAGAFAFAILLTVFLLYSPYSIDDTSQQVATQQDIVANQTEQIAILELLSSPEDLETATDPAFYVWMDEILATESTDNAV